MKRILNISLGALLLSVPMFAYAFQPGLYITAAIGPTVDYVSNEFTTDETAYHASFGYQFTEVAAVESGYTLHQPAGLDNLHTHYLALKLILPLQDIVALYAKAGAGRLYMSGYDKYLPFVGIGMDFNLGPNVAITALAQGFPSDNQGIGFVGGGLTYRLF